MFYVSFSLSCGLKRMVWFSVIQHGATVMWIHLSGRAGLWMPPKPPVTSLCLMMRAPAVWQRLTQRGRHLCLTSTYLDIPMQVNPVWHVRVVSKVQRPLQNAFMTFMVFKRFSKMSFLFCFCGLLYSFFLCVKVFRNLCKIILAEHIVQKPSRRPCDH